MERPVSLQFALELASLFPGQGEWTEADYVSLPESARLTELSQGTLIMSPVPSFDLEARTICVLSLGDGEACDEALLYLSGDTVQSVTLPGFAVPVESVLPV